VAILFTIPWIILDTRLKRLELFYQLSKLEAASAAKSLCLDYSGALSFATTLKALFNQHWEVLVLSLLVFCSHVIVPLAPEIVRLGLLGSCSSTISGCVGVLGTMLLVARVTEGLLVVMAVLVALLILILWKLVTGVYAEPFSIAGVATLLHSPAVLEQFRRFNM
jgi:hypothetical protein